MNQRTLPLIAALLGIFLLAGWASAAQQVTISDVTLDKDGSGTASIYLSGAPDGLSVFRINLKIDDTDIVDSITRVDYPTTTFTNFDTNKVTTNPCTAAFSNGYVKAGAASTSLIPNGSTNILLATITVHGRSGGTTTITPTILRLDDNHGGDYIPTTTINVPTVTVTGSASAAAATTTASSATTATTATTVVSPTATTTTTASTTTASTTTVAATSTTPAATVVTSAINGGPVCSFAAKELAGSAPFKTSFQDYSSGSPTSWEWDFGDGGTSMAQNPSYLYESPGTYSVSLTVTNEIASTTNTRAAYITVLKPGETIPVTQTIAPSPQKTMAAVTSRAATPTPIRRPSAPTTTKSAPSPMAAIAVICLGIAGGAVLHRRQR